LLEKLNGDKWHNCKFLIANLETFEGGASSFFYDIDNNNTFAKIYFKRKTLIHRG